MLQTFLNDLNSIFRNFCKQHSSKSEVFKIFIAQENGNDLIKECLTKFHLSNSLIKIIFDIITFIFVNISTESDFVQLTENREFCKAIFKNGMGLDSDAFHLTLELLKLFEKLQQEWPNYYDRFVQWLKENRLLDNIFGAVYFSQKIEYLVKNFLDPEVIFIGQKDYIIYII